ncbi:MAG TPA: PepSY domain-containing protein [Tepidisphaeraceae bacterium]|jgi:uncharacterized membrane protein YkoI
MKRAFLKELIMWKKMMAVSVISASIMVTAGCHANHSKQTKPAMQDAETNDQQVAIADIPSKVLTTVQHHVPDGTIVSVEMSDWHDREIYEIDVRQGNAVYEVKVHRGGKFISKNVDND